MLGTSDTWSTVRLSHRPSLLYCKLTDFRIDSWPKIDVLKGNYCLVASRQKLGSILEKKCLNNWSNQKCLSQKMCSLIDEMIKKILEKNLLIFDILSDFGPFWQLVTMPIHNIIISFENIDFLGPKIYLILYPSLENSITHITWGACYGCPGAEISAWVFWGVRPNSWTRPRCPPTWRWRLTTFLVGSGGHTHGCAEAHGRGLAVWPGPNISQYVWKK